MDDESLRVRMVEGKESAATLEAALADAASSDEIVEVRVAGLTVAAVVPPSLLPRLRRARRRWNEQDAALQRVRAAFAEIDPAEIERHLDERDDHALASPRHSAP